MNECNSQAWQPTPQENEVIGILVREASRHQNVNEPAFIPTLFDQFLNGMGTVHGRHLSVDVSSALNPQMRHTVWRAHASKCGC
jgi:hypothetical protein